MSSTDERHGTDERETKLAAAWRENHPKTDTTTEEPA